MKIGVLCVSASYQDVIALVCNYCVPDIVFPEKRAGHLDALIIPESYGIPGVFKMNSSPVFELVDPLLERFFTSESGLKYFIDREIPVIGIGKSSSLLFEYESIPFKLLGDRIVTKEKVKEPNKTFLSLESVKGELDKIKYNLEQDIRLIKDERSKSGDIKIYTGQGAVLAPRPKNREAS